MPTGYSDGIRKAADAGRKAAEPWVRPTIVTVVVETWSGPYGAVGSTLLSTQSTVLTPRPKVVAVGDQGASAFGGGYASSSSGGLTATEYEIGPVTPSYPGGGYTVAELLPLGASNKNVYIILSDGAYESTGERFRVVPGSLVATPSYRTTFRVVRTNQS
jgi:hypothetical protein